MAKKLNSANDSDETKSAEQLTENLRKSIIDTAKFIGDMQKPTTLYQAKSTEQGGENIRQRIIDYLQEHGAASISEIAEALKLSPINIVRYLNDLERYGLLEQEELQQSKKRPRKAFKLHDATTDTKSKDAPRVFVMEPNYSLAMTTDRGYDFKVLRLGSTAGAATAVEFKLVIDSAHSKYELTPSFLESEVMPYLVAIEDLQRIVDEIRHRRHQAVTVNSIVSGSIDVSLNGASEIVEVIKNTVVPWRRKHQVQLARLTEEEKAVEIEKKKAEVLRSRAQAETERQEAKLKSTEIARRELENAKLRQEIEFAPIRLALEVLQQLAPGLPEEQKIAYVMKLLAPLKVMIDSPLTIEADSQTDKS